MSNLLCVFLHFSSFKSEIQQFRRRIPWTQFFWVLIAQAASFWIKYTIDQLRFQSIKYTIESMIYCSYLPDIFLKFFFIKAFLTFTYKIENKEKKRERRRHTHTHAYILQTEEYKAKHTQSYYSNSYLVYNRLSSKCGEGQVVMKEQPGHWSQSETAKYFEWLIIYN